MKKIIIILIIIHCSLSSKAQFFQNPKYGSQIVKDPLSNNYFYNPKQYLKLPSKIFVAYVYEIGESYFYKITPVNRVANRLLINYKVGDSVKAVASVIIDSSNNIIDNNSNIGFINFLKQEVDSINMAECYFQAANLLSYYAQRTLKLDNRLLKDIMINYYELGLKLSPNGLKDLNYEYYLTLLHNKKQKAVKTQLGNYAKAKSKATNDEKSLLSAIKIYRVLKMYADAKKIEVYCLKNFPKGELAKTIFINKIDTNYNFTSSELIDTLKYATSQFKSITNNDNYTFFLKLANIFYNENSWTTLYNFEYLVNNKITLARIYIKYAKVFYDDELKGIKSKIITSKALSQRALFYLNEEIRLKRNQDQEDRTFDEDYYNHAALYSQILNCSQQYDSAFYYQDKVFKRGNLSKEDLERYCIYLEKAKGQEIAKIYLEEQLIKGVVSPNMLAQLQSIYTNLNLPLESFELLKKHAKEASNEKLKKNIYWENGNSYSKPAILKDLQGKSINLSDFKSKIILLDFWATWCAPCLASFPEMKKLVEKYENDSDVVILFINVLENEPFDKLATKIKQLVKNYNFNVLIDTENLMPEKYKIDFIPKKIIINKANQITFIREETDNISEIIEFSKR